jgi:hypothetical protein
MTSHFRSTYQILEQLLKEFQSLQGIEYYSAFSANMLSSLGYAVQTEYAGYVGWLSQQNIDFIAYAMRGVVYLILHRSSHQEANYVIDMQTPPYNDREILKLVAESLKLGIHFIENGRNLEFFEDSSDSKPVIFIGKHDGEYQVLNHKDYLNNQNFETYPYVYKRTSAPPAPPAPINAPPMAPPQPVNASQSKQESNSIFTGLLKQIIKIMNDRQWRFGSEEKKKIKLYLKNLKKFKIYQEEVKILKSLIEESLCSHSFGSFFLFTCGKLHCRECFHEEITLKKLLKHQIYCSCKKLLQEKELAYFFKDDIKASNEFSVKNPLLADDMMTISQMRQGPGIPPQSMGIPPQGMGIPPQGMGIPPPGMGIPPPGLGIPPPGPATGMPPEIGRPQQTFNQGAPEIPPLNPGINANPPGLPNLPPGIGVPNMSQGFSGFPPGIPGFPPGAPQGIPPGNPPNIPGLVLSSNNSGYSGNPALIPKVVSPKSGLPSGIPMPSHFMNESGTISMPRVNFCAKCGAPINPAEIVYRDGKSFHGKCN